jgi:sulfite exporter TauE/SafE
VGPDHTLPFVMLARARGWSRARTLWITGLCGLAHVASSIVLGALGLGLGRSSDDLAAVESSRGDLAAWALVALGTVYGLWGLRVALRSRSGLSLHSHRGHVHLHPHGELQHEHDGSAAPQDTRRTTFWALFVVFVLGPCEPLIPLYFIPASQGQLALAGWAAVVFSVSTVATMLVLVGLAHSGLARVRLQRLERWSHALAGAVISASGLAVLFGGL